MMRLLMFRDADGPRLGALRGTDVIDLRTLSTAVGGDRLPEDMLGLIDMGEEGLRRVRSLLATADSQTVSDQSTQYVRPLFEIQLLPPLNPPRANVIAIGRNYLEHAQESARVHGEEEAALTVFTKAQTSVTGPNYDVPLHESITKEVDWEVELGVVIGRRGVNIRRDEALDYLFGYTVVNDLSARDVQYGWGGQFFKGKSLNGFCPIGPWIVTSDEIADPQNLELCLRVNGETKQDANTSDMIHPVDDLVALLSVGMTLVPGNLIATGTPAGIGMARTPPEYLKPGDVVEAEVEGIGILRNRMVPASER
jgi:2-keto-4-pentenoate hydratase/2-oxohepta-3-ene-1,7-dioic acid hydratase in catechol pathway